MTRRSRNINSFTQLLTNFTKYSNDNIVLSVCKYGDFDYNAKIRTILNNELCKYEQYIESFKDNEKIILVTASFKNDVVGFMAMQYDECQNYCDDDCEENNTSLQNMFSIVLICAKQVKINNIPVRVGFELIKFYFHFLKENKQPFGFLEMAEGFLNKKAYVLYHIFDFYPYPLFLCQKYMSTHGSSLLNVCMVAEVPSDLGEFFTKVLNKDKYTPKNGTLMNKQIKYLQENLEIRLRLLKTQEWKNIYTEINKYLINNLQESFFGESETDNFKQYMKMSIPVFWKKNKKKDGRRKSRSKKQKKTIYNDGFTVETPVYPFNTCKVFKNI